MVYRHRSIWRLAVNFSALHTFDEHVGYLDKMSHREINEHVCYLDRAL